MSLTSPNRCGSRFRKARLGTNVERDRSFGATAPAVLSERLGSGRQEIVIGG
jgi:hypothetical protein